MGGKNGWIGFLREIVEYSWIILVKEFNDPKLTLATGGLSLHDVVVRRQAQGGLVLSEAEDTCLLQAEFLCTANGFKAIVCSKFSIDVLRVIADRIQ